MSLFVRCCGVIHQFLSDLLSGWARLIGSRPPATHQRHTLDTKKAPTEDLPLRRRGWTSRADPGLPQAPAHDATRHLVTGRPRRIDAFDRCVQLHLLFGMSVGGRSAAGMTCFVSAGAIVGPGQRASSPAPRRGPAFRKEIAAATAPNGEGCRAVSTATSCTGRAASEIQTAGPRRGQLADQGQLEQFELNRELPARPELDRARRCPRHRLVDARRRTDLRPSPSALVALHLVAAPSEGCSSAQLRKQQRLAFWARRLGHTWWIVEQRCLAPGPLPTHRTALNARTSPVNITADAGLQAGALQRPTQRDRYPGRPTASPTTPSAC